MNRGRLYSAFLLALLLLSFSFRERALAIDGAQEMALDDAMQEFLDDQGKLLKKGKTDEVISTLAQAVLATNHSEIWRLLGKAYYQKQAMLDAIYCYTVVSKLKPQDSTVTQWLQGALQGRAGPEIRTAPALVFSLHGVVDRDSLVWIRGQNEKEMRKAPRSFVFKVEAGTGMLSFIVAFGVEEGQAYWVSLGDEYRAKGEISFGGDKPFPAGQKILPPGFDPAAPPNKS